MMPALEQKIAIWEKQLLDLSRRNKLINCGENKRGVLTITQPGMLSLYEQIVGAEKKLSFTRHVTRAVDARVYNLMRLMRTVGAPLRVTLGDIQSTQTVEEQARTLRLLKNKARLAQDEQGQNLLYLAVGFVRWYDEHGHQAVMNSPLLLVPVALQNNAPSEPYYLQALDDEIVVNPTLAYLFSDRYHFEFPPFDAERDGLSAYFAKLKKLFAAHGWALAEECRLGIFSFQKLNMYKDLVDNEAKVLANPVLQAMYTSHLVKNQEELPAHDAMPVTEVCQIISADSSQLDAVERSRRGESFVLQGPPGTGKSQTITNIIAQALADGKRILFVSEKMAALQVVYSRLVKAGLGDFCLPLHDHRANKKEILQMIGDSLEKKVVRGVPGAAEDAQRLERLRGRLMRYPAQLHQVRHPLGISLYDAFGWLLSLQDVTTVLLRFDGVEGMVIGQLLDAQEYLQRLSALEERLTLPAGENPWRHFRPELYGQEQRMYAMQLMQETHRCSSALMEAIRLCREEMNWPLNSTETAIAAAVDMAEKLLELPAVPAAWLELNAEDCRAQLKIYDGLQLSHNSLEESLRFSLLQLPAWEKVLQEFGGLHELNQRMSQMGVRLEGLTQAAYDAKTAREKLSAWLEAWRGAFPEMWKESDTIADAQPIWEAAQTLADLPEVPVEWLDAAKRRKLLLGVRILADAESDIRKNAAALRLEYSEDIFDYLPQEESLVTLMAAGKQAAEQQAGEVYPEAIRQLLALRKEQEAEPDFNAIAWAAEAERLLSPGDGQLAAVSHLDDATEQLTLLQTLLAQLPEMNNVLPEGISLRSMEDYHQVQLAFDAIEKAGLFPVRWLAARHRAEARRAMAAIVAKQKECAEREQAILTQYDPGVFTLDCDTLLRRFRTEHTTFLKYLRGQYHSDVRLVASYRKAGGHLEDGQIIQLLTELIDLLAAQKALAELTAAKKPLFMDSETVGEPDWASLAAGLELLDDPRIAGVLERLSEETPALTLKALLILRREVNAFRVNEIMILLDRWLPDAAAELCHAPDRMAEKAADRLAQMERLVRLFELLPPDAATGASRTEQLAAMQRRADRHLKLIASCLLNLGGYRRQSSRFNKTAEQISGLLQPLWRGHDTDFAQVERLLQMLHTPHIARVLENAYSQSAALPHEEGLARLRALQPHSPQALLDALQTVEPAWTALPAREVEEKLQARAGVLSGMDALLTKVTPLCAVMMSAAEKLRTLERLLRWADMERQNAAAEAAKKRLAGSSYAGWRTDWNALLALLEELGSFCEAHAEQRVRETPRYRLAAQEYREKLSAWAAQTDEALKGYQAAGEKYGALFTAEDWLGLSLTERHDQLETAARWPDLLDQYQQQEQCMRVIRQNGLEDAVAAMRAAHVPPQQYADAYTKAFLLAWIGRNIMDAPDVEAFDGAAYGADVRRFQVQDDHYFEVSKVELQHKLTARMPHASGFSSGELAILQHEMNKKARIMPIRKLFRQIPYLLQALKPCLMMSPLSVSYFLDSAFYQFDMVIFDEASQIFPQDAIGAILRGKQAIIAGDVKQMPPSNFFATGAEDDAEELEEDQPEGTPLGDSILEEASFMLPQTSLLWHYRSRDEGLIAFSNQHFYKNNLYTFPNNNICQEDMGVEYIHVPDGLYQNRRNTREAQECVRLIYRHIQRHPERSLGVVAFSEAQQAEIEDLLWQQRERLPQFEAFFDEDKPEPFFIKNLENVQGDERDTIIFSICYVRGLDGRMRLNFGPLGKPGGERRLNVAVTRARYNVKLTGSILPADIDLNRAKSEGARLLRSYIEYARSTHTASVETADQAVWRDRFADAVTKFLTDKGYVVSRNVGRSAYRVDIAVHGGSGGQSYLAGILCDGEGYASARTVRDRDSIRRKMLANLGWQIIDCWSTEWAEHPEGAKKTLLEQLTALRQSGPAPVRPPEETEKIKIEYEPDPAAADEENHHAAPVLGDYRVEVYPARAPHQPQAEYQQQALLHYVTMEQPIHLDVLCQRMAPHCSKTRVTPVVRETVQRMLASPALSQVTVQDGFCTLNGHEAVTARRAGGREIEHISHAELTDALRQLLQASFGMDRAGVILEVARMLGFARSGMRIEARLQESLSRMEQQGLITIVQDKVQWKGDAE